MNLEKHLTYVTHHSESIIQWLFFGILLLSGLLIARAVFGKKSADGGGAAASGEVHSALEKILAQTAKLESLSLEKMSAGGVANVDAQVQALKADLAARETEISTLKANGGGDGGKLSAEAGALGARIKELEAKLSEYEILEDDIADLSLYKEENARLRTELDKVKGGGAPAADTAAVPAAAAVAPPAGDIVQEFAQAVGDAPVAAPAAVMPDTGNPMADFESTVKLEKKLTGGEPVTAEPAPEAAPAPVAAAPAAAPPPAPAVAPAPAAPAAAAAQAEADDLFAEFASPNAEDAANLDTDKMMAEMAALVGMEPATGSSLEESIDTDKMAAEASSFQKS